MVRAIMGALPTYGLAYASCVLLWDVGPFFVASVSGERQNGSAWSQYLERYTGLMTRGVMSHDHS